MYLPNAENAFIAKEKLLEYLLHDENSKGKSIFFNQYGYFKDNFEILIQDLKLLALHGQVTKIEETKFGENLSLIWRLLLQTIRKQLFQAFG